MKKVQIYLVNDVIYFAPTVSKGRMVSKMIYPIKSVLINESYDCIGSQLLSAVEDSKTTDQEIPKENEVFKQFLKISKTKSNLQLVKQAQFIKVDCDDQKCTLVKVGGNIKHKAFVEDLGIPSSEIDLKNNSVAEIGAVIIDLFLKSGITEDIIPVV